jgi:hypothetical protein
MHPAFTQTLLDLGRDVYKGTPCRDIEPELFAEAFHNSLVIQQTTMQALTAI